MEEDSPDNKQEELPSWNSVGIKTQRAKGIVGLEKDGDPAEPKKWAVKGLTRPTRGRKGWRKREAPLGW